MAYWLAREREGQTTDVIQRFDARYWTVDFPRGDMASVVTTAPDALRVDCELHLGNGLVGLIWESEDRFDHPLLSYDTDRNFALTTLRFRWQSDGVLPLDAVHGPTLTLEGRDAGGNARTWYVRLWNYAVGTPTDAVVTLPFSQLQEGWMADGAAVDPADIDRMFISLVAPGYDPAATGLLPQSATGWVELSDIHCDGDRSMLTIGDALLPPHGLGMCTAYDDSYNLTPARMLRQCLHLGYRDALVHYVGMSHYYRLVRDGGNLQVTGNAELNTPCTAWHTDYFARCAEYGFEPIVSLSFELLAEHSPLSWSQRAFNGDVALTGWSPPSTLLSPYSNAVRFFLDNIAEAFVSLTMAAGLPVKFQIGEPWWWVMADGRPCLYDDNVLASLPNSPDIPDLSEPLTFEQIKHLNWCGSILALTTRRLRDAVRRAAGGNAEVYLLVFTPTVLDSKWPELRRANMPTGWAYPAYDRLQLEDYDWLTVGAEALRLRAYDTVQQRLSYPLELQDYLSGFVLLPEDASDYWRHIDAGVDEAIERGVERQFVWAFPQVLRDGYVRLPPIPKEDLVQSFDDVLYPLALGRDASASPEFSTAISLTASGHERRNSQWSDARMNYDVGPGIRSQAELGVLLEFFRARRGPARGFRLADPFDHSSNGLTGSPTATDQLIGIGDGLAATYQLAKSYGPADDPQVRPITRPRADTIVVSVDGVANTAWTLRDGGRIVFTYAPADGAEVRAGFLFDVPVRFAQDRLDISGATFAAGDAPSVPLIEIREDV
ncbi:DUF2460 domain-containing protein [Aurantiacibacter gangjinensis]|uniref:Uncharacterized protein n=1 Tax=Aurantiacibacter gangjinensis TaxID=502682 RepID=A0A0G9MLW2_9SPHN|nr:DUF2460 domain-containing protein [Aurantiacibacter gangjinensis]APE27652.1 Gene Transfer Agent (GTA) ORFG12b [Aurantiacibacter gangjinensis]KLE31672.1 hypothetical protein AAW01_09115 [Aurantiacibacter gangjinensis]